MKKKILALFLVLILGISLLSCVKSAPKEEYQDNILEITAEEEHLTPTEGGTLNLCMYNVDTLNPLITKSLPNTEILSIMYDSLFTLGDDLYPEYNLCENVEVSGDGLIYKLKIRDDFIFHSGEKLTAEDVSHSISLLKASGGALSSKVKNVSAVSHSGNTVTVTLDAPVFNFISNLTFPIINSKGSVESAINSAIDYLPDGTGIYKLINYKFNKTLLLTAVDLEDSDKTPYIKDVKIEIVKNRQTAISSLENGLCDVLSPHVAKEGEYLKNQSIKEVEISGGSFVFLGVNNQHTVLLDSEIRNALSKLINRDAFFEIKGENIKKTSIPVHPSSWLFYDMHPSGEYLPDEAKEILKNKGFTDSDLNGTLDKIILDEKVDLNFEILVNSENPERLKCAEAIKKDLAQAGISTYILSVPFNEYQERIAQKSYDLFIGEIQFSQNQDITSFISGQENMFGAYKEELFYALEDAKKLAKTDDIKGAYALICGKLSENMPVIGLYFESDYLLVNNRINGKLTPNISNIFYKISDWFIY